MKNQKTPASTTKKKTLVAATSQSHMKVFREVALGAFPVTDSKTPGLVAKLWNWRQKSQKSV